jgi:hypothetical protein
MLLPWTTRAAAAHLWVLDSLVDAQDHAGSLYSAPDRVPLVDSGLPDACRHGVTDVISINVHAHPAACSATLGVSLPQLVQHVCGIQASVVTVICCCVH